MTICLKLPKLDATTQTKVRPNLSSSLTPTKEMHSSFLYMNIATRTHRRDRNFSFLEPYL